MTTTEYVRQTPATDAARRLETAAPGDSAELMAHAARIERFERLADWLDTRFRLPVIGYRIGLDGILGLVPGVGDTLTTALSAYLVYEAHRAGARRRTLGRMGWNVAVDWVLGLVPLVGDILDVAHKANARNARLLVDELREIERLRRAEGAIDVTPRRAA